MYGSARAASHIDSSPSRSPRLPRSPRLGHRRVHSGGGGGGGGGGGKTLSMENIQSLNAAYATSGPMYLSDQDAVGSTSTYPKGTVTLGRASPSIHPTPPSHTRPPPSIPLLPLDRKSTRLNSSH